MLLARLANQPLRSLLLCLGGTSAANLRTTHEKVATRQTLRTLSCGAGVAGRQLAVQRGPKLSVGGGSGASSQAERSSKCTNNPDCSPTDKSFALNPGPNKQPRPGRKTLDVRRRTESPIRSTSRAARRFTEFRRHHRLKSGSSRVFWGGRPHLRVCWNS